MKTLLKWFGISALVCVLLAIVPGSQVVSWAGGSASSIGDDSLPGGTDDQISGDPDATSGGLGRNSVKPGGSAMRPGAVLTSSSRM
jgi:hypothetical protein